MKSLRRRLALIASLILAAAPAPAADAAAGPSAARDAATAWPGTSAAVPGWWIQSTKVVSAGGEEVSRPGFPVAGWSRTSRRSTVMAGLLENGRYPDVFYSTTMRDKIDPKAFEVPWWYRTEFTGGRSRHTFLRLNGVISRADVWLNGTRIATRDQVAGAFRATELAIDGQVRPGRNVLAILVQPNDPQRDFTLGWIDWAPAPPDRDMGVWRDVEIAHSGAVSLRDPRVLTDLRLPALDRAELTVKADVRNDDDRPRTTTIDGTAGPVRLRDGTAGPLRFRKTLSLAAHEARTVTFDPLPIRRPQVWWPYQMGGQPMYDLRLTARVDGRLSDRAHKAFGIRTVSSRLTEQGHRQFLVNGKPLLIRGAGWASDLFLRYEPRRLEDQLRYVRDLGLNTIRTEGKLEHDEFYDLADRYGIMILPGWECCDKWEPWSGWGGDEWTAADLPVAAGSMRSEARRLRNHPSVLAFLIASDVAPPADVEKLYVDALHRTEWPNPIISAAASRGAPPITGPSGMKMEGPYDWVPPNYWYGDQLGAAFGFASELSAGESIPTLVSLRKMLSPAELEDLWRNPESQQYHSARPGSLFASLRLFSTALAKRYGKPTSLADYVEKAQLAAYENVRAQFEAYGRNMTAANPSTGLIYWMLNNAWPSLHWHLYDYYLKPSAAYFGAKKANEPLHVQYSYDDRSIAVVNFRPRAASGLTVRACVYNLDGTRKFTAAQRGVAVPANGVARPLAIPELAGLSGTYLVRLELSDSHGRTVSRNTYWLSTQPDVLDWNSSDWYYTPVKQYARLDGLAGLPKAQVRATASHGPNGATVQLRNISSHVAIGLRVTLLRPRGGEVLPLTWSDNHIALWPGETVTLRADYRPSDAGGTPQVHLTGWNLKN